MKNDKDFECYVREMRLKSLLLSGDAEYITGGVFHQESAVQLLLDLYQLFQTDSFILLDTSLFLVVYKILNQLVFRFSKIEDIKRIRKQILYFLKKEITMYDGLQKLKVKKMIEEEIRTRKIPAELSLTKNDIIGLYKTDYEHYIAMSYHDTNISRLKLFNFVSLLHKINDKYPEYLKRNKNVIVQAIYELKKQECETLQDEVTQKYIQSILPISNQTKEDKIKRKIIPFPRPEEIKEG